MKHREPGSNKPHPNQNHGSAKENKRDISGSIEIRGVVETKIPPDLAKKREAAADKKETREKHRFFVEVVTLIFVIIYATFAGVQAWETNRSVKLAQDANNLTMETVRARLVVTDSRLSRPIAPGEQAELTFSFKNAGRSTAFYGITNQVFRWAAMPDGDSPPLAYPDPSIPLEENIPNDNVILDRDLMTQGFIDEIPTLKEVMESTSERTHGIGTRNFDSPKPTLYFVIRLVYESIGPRREIDYCSFLVRRDYYASYMNLSPAGDPKYILMSCPKWNGTYEKMDQK